MCSRQSDAQLNRSLSRKPRLAGLIGLCRSSRRLAGPLRGALTWPCLGWTTPGPPGSRRTCDKVGRSCSKYSLNWNQPVSGGNHCTAVRRTKSKTMLSIGLLNNRTTGAPAYFRAGRYIQNAVPRVPPRREPHRGTVALQKPSLEVVNSVGKPGMTAGKTGCPTTLKRAPHNWCRSHRPDLPYYQRAPVFQVRMRERKLHRLVVTGGLN